MTILENLMTRLAVRRRLDARTAGLAGMSAGRMPSLRTFDDEYGAPESMLPSNVIESLRSVEPGAARGRLALGR